MKPRIRLNTVFVSDLHLGTPDSKVEELNEFLSAVDCRTLVLNGDIIDGWHLKRGGHWSSRHTSFVRLILKKMEEEGMRVIYLRGNHDDILERFLPLDIGGMTIAGEHIHDSPHGRYLVVHGDGFDQVTTNHRWLAVLGAIGYDLLLLLNRHYNRYREWTGKERFSLSKLIKAKVKSAVSFVGRFEEQLCHFARQRDCTGIICGHIHTPANRRIDGIHYLNSGDWVESLTAIIEHLDGRLEVVEHSDFMRRIKPPRPATPKPLVEPDDESSLALA